MKRAFLIAIAVGLLFPAAASACSIAARPPADRMKEADLAVWGKVISRQRTDEEDRPGGPGEIYRYRFRVREIYKGRVRRRITLVGSTDSAACGIGLLRVGDRLGFLLGGRRGPWRVATPDLITRRELRSVRRPRRV